MIKKFFNSRLTLAVLLFLLAVVILFNLPQTARGSKLFLYNMILNRWEHFIPCEDLPFLQQVNKTFDKHPGEVNQIKHLPGVADFKPNMVKCVDSNSSFYFVKGEAEVDYKSWSPRAAVESLLGSKTFFGTPIRGQKQ